MSPTAKPDPPFTNETAVITPPLAVTLTTAAEPLEAKL